MSENSVYSEPRKRNRNKDIMACAMHSYHYRHSAPLIVALPRIYLFAPFSLTNDRFPTAPRPFFAIKLTPFSSSPSGPEKWGELFPLALGKRQSPIDISTQSTTKGSELAVPLQIKYVPENTRVSCFTACPFYDLKLDLIT